MPERPIVTWESLNLARVRIPRMAFVDTPDEAVDFFGSLTGGTVAIKADTQVHKSAAGLVCIGLATADDVRSAFRQLRRRLAELGIDARLMVQQMIPPGPEVFVGLSRDPAFGPVVAAGLGGRLIESINRKALLLPPVTVLDARRALSAIGVTTLGLKAAEEDLVHLIKTVADVAESQPQVHELDLNPVILLESGAWAVDLRVVYVDDPDGAGSTSRLPSHGSAESILRRLTNPQRVAVIGASDDPKKPGGRAFRLLTSLSPDVCAIPVNPRGGTIDGIAVLPSIADLPPDVDVAVIATAAHTVPDLIRQLGAANVPSAVVFASGFQEVGNFAGEEEVRAVARTAGVRVCGVNSMGIVGRTPLTFSHAMNVERVDGNVSFLTQSGAIGGSLLIGAWSQGLGTANFISVGNETDLCMAEYLDFLATDSRTKTVGIFLEGVNDGQAFRHALVKARQHGRRVVVLHAGTSEVGAASARSHTGALAGSGAVYRAALEACGAVVATDIPELLGICQALAWQPESAGRKVGVVSTSGGGCSLVADHLDALGLEVPQFDDSTRATLRSVLPSFAETKNPIDTTGAIAGDPAMLERLLDPVLRSESTDSTIIAISALVGEAAEVIADGIIRATADCHQPIVVSWMVPEAAAAEAFSRLRAARIPVFASTQIACAALAALSVERHDRDRSDDD